MPWCPHSFYLTMVASVLDNECIGTIVFPCYIRFLILEIKLSVLQNYNIYCCSSYLILKSTWILVHTKLCVLIAH